MIKTEEAHRPSFVRCGSLCAGPRLRTNDGQAEVVPQNGANPPVKDSEIVRVKHGHVKTESTLKMDEEKGRWEITSIELNVITTLPDGNQGELHRAVRAAKTKSGSAPVF